MNAYRRFSTAVSIPVYALLLAGCCCGGKGRREGPTGKNAVASSRRQSAFDFYCAMRPVVGRAPTTWGTVVFETMKAQDYKVYLVRYDTRHAPTTSQGRVRPAGYGLRDFFSDASTLENFQPQRSVAYQSGYGMRDFFGDRAAPEGAQPAPGAGAPRATRHADQQSHNAAKHPSNTGAEQKHQWNREAVLWETRRGEFFLVDGPYATPVWVKGQSWIERVRFCYPAASSVSQVRS